MTVIRVSLEQVLAARIEILALTTAGLTDEIDPLIVELANALVLDTTEPPPSAVPGDAAAGAAGA